MKKLFTLIVLACFSSPLFSQDCLPDGITFSTQEEIDSFSVNYPGCEHIPGTVTIDGSSPSDITNLNGLNSITSIGGALQIWNTVLTSFSGLENLTSIGGNFSINFNDSLISPGGLENLISVGGWLNFQFNGSLLNLHGLENLSSLGGDLKISSNFALISVLALNNLSSIGGELELLNNPNLSFCHIPFICNNFAQLNPNIIGSNASGCNDLIEISEGCQSLAGYIHYPIFYDINANAVLDNGEPYLPQTTVLINPGNITAYGNTYNGGSYFLENGTYDLEYNQADSPNWQLTSGNSSYTITIDQNNPIDTIYFGLSPIDSISDISPSLVSGMMLCNDIVLFTATAYNDGTLPAQGTLWLQVDDRITNIQYLDNPDTIVPPYLYGWHYDNLFPGYSISKKIWLGIPGPPNFSIGNMVHFSSYTHYEDTNGTHESNQFNYDPIVQCSFDPNDKLVQPANPGGYALSDGELIYTIRFQNTGITEIYHVLIRDTLSAHLDPATFHLISSSHEAFLSTSILEDRYLNFNFQYIFLPGSITDFQGSHGYVQYGIRPNAGLPDLTQINNTAAIYFDSNPPVITNTTENTLVTSFDVDEDGFELWLDCDDGNASINPNAIDIPDNGIDEDCDGSDTLVITLCLPDGITFYNQQEIDDFAINYPDCKHIQGNVTIYGDLISEITNLHALNALISISGDLRVTSTELTSFTGLENLAFVGGELIIEYNEFLGNLNGLESLSSVEGNVKIYYNHVITSFDGLENLSSIGGGLFIENNSVLNSLSGLINLTTIGDYLLIQHNDSLLEFSGLEHLVTVGGYLDISWNNALTSFNGLENLSSVGDYLHILSNIALTSFSSLSNLSSVGDYIQIQHNDSLASFNGLGNLATVGGFLDISWNSDLTSLDGLEHLTTVGGYLNILNNGSLTNIHGLENLNTVGGYLSIREDDALTSLIGLGNLASIGGYLDITNNNFLASLNGLEMLSSVEEALYIRANDSLTNLNGLENITTVGGTLFIYFNHSLSTLNGIGNLTNIGGPLFIEGNSALYNLNGLENLTSIGDYVQISSNNALTSLSALNNLSSINGTVDIYNNHSLSICQIPFFCNNLDQSSSFDIFNNAPGCNNLDELSDGCFGIAGYIHYPLFYDINANAVLDNGEPYLPQASVLINPGNITAYGNAYNGGLYLLDDGNYSVEYNQAYSPNWQLTSGIPPYTFTLDEENLNDTIYLGLSPVDSISDISTSLVSGIVRCNEMVLFTAIANNEGTLPTQGTLWLQVDENITDVQYFDTPDTIAPPYLYGWHYDYLFPGYNISKKIWLGIPGPPDFPIGDMVQISSFTHYTDANGTNESVPFIYNSVVQCSFDPNDKLVQPANPGGYALLDGNLVYTIRFQNTGNAEAYNVLIRDTVSEYLDPATFRVLSSSHEPVLSTSLIDEKHLNFFFENIFLPDSSTNFQESQGYVQYSIRPNAGLPELTQIYNTAGIYFDSNPPVITNTTENILVSSFDADEDGIELWADCDDSDSNINPNATETPNNDTDEDCDGIAQIIDLDNDNYNSSVDCDDNDVAVNPGATEIPNNDSDEDCDGTALIIDEDNDNFNSSEDCDDSDATINPEATEILNNDTDEDCDGIAQIIDEDNDNFNSSEDCDDSDATINPGATEIPNNDTDEDCDGTTLITDEDNDNFNSSEDCDDNNAAINPGATEIPNNETDEDCDGTAQIIDEDNDTFNSSVDCDDGNAAINPNATEIPNNGIDEDCDGTDSTVATNTPTEKSIRMYPQPTSGLLMLELPFESDANLQVKDQNGKSLMELHFQTKTILDLSHLPAGVYFLWIQSQEATWIERVVKI